MSFVLPVTQVSPLEVDVPSDGLPAALQIVGRQRADLGVLPLAHAFEQETRHGRRAARC